MKDLTIRTKTWSELQDLYYDKKADVGFSQLPREDFRWIFRADKIDKNDMYKPPQTALERAFDLYGIRDEDKTGREREILREFQRKAALYIENEPHKNDVLEWLALMRHYGAPTRLLDWTYSYFVSVYFALAENQSGVVWALNVGALKMNRANDIIAQIPEGDHKDDFEKFRDKLKDMDDIMKLRSSGCRLIDLALVCCFIKHNPVSTVYAINPFRLNERLTVQQGLFLVQGNILKSFWDNLIENRSEEELQNNVFRIEINVEKAQRNEIIARLREMNITNATLFPDLGGFSKSLEESMARSPLIIDRCD